MERQEAGVLGSNGSPSAPRRNNASRFWTSLSYVLWFSIGLTFLVSQIVASVVILIRSKDEKPHVPLRAWNLGYLSGCVFASALLVWGYSVQKKVLADAVGGMIREPSADTSKNSPRMEARLDFFKWLLYCFSLAWFILGCVWISKARSSRSDAPQLFRLCIANLIFCGIGYAIWFVLGSTVVMCCCLPWILAFFGLMAAPFS